jgi:hypothetical protein
MPQNHSERLNFAIKVLGADKTMVYLSYKALDWWERGKFVEDLYKQAERLHKENLKPILKRKSHA